MAGDSENAGALPITSGSWRRCRALGGDALIAMKQPGVLSLAYFSGNSCSAEICVWILVTGAGSPSPTLSLAASPSLSPATRELSAWFRILPRIASMGSILSVPQTGRPRPGGPRVGVGPSLWPPSLPFSPRKGGPAVQVLPEHRWRLALPQDRGHFHLPSCLPPRPQLLGLFWKV